MSVGTARDNYASRFGYWLGVAWLAFAPALAAQSEPTLREIKQLLAQSRHEFNKIAGAVSASVW